MRSPGSFILLLVAAIFLTTIHAKATSDLVKLVGNPVESILAISRPDHLALFRPGSGVVWILENVGGQFRKVFGQGSPGNNEIGGYNPGSTNDRAITFDFEHSGIPNYILFYRPGGNSTWILKNVQGSLTVVPYAGYPTSTIGGYNLSSLDDKALAFDYDHSGNLDHLVFYRPGSSKISIIKNVNGEFSQVFASENGIGGFDLISPLDRVVPFDYNKTGKEDHLVFFRPGTGIIWILKNENGQFRPVFIDAAKDGIGGYDLRHESDLGFAFDYESTGKPDHLVFYRPGSRKISIIKNVNGQFSQVFSSENGIGGFDLISPLDRVVAFDYNKTGKEDHLVFFRAGTGIIWILKNEKGQFHPVFIDADKDGIGGYDLKSVHDQIFPLDYLSGF